MEPMTLEASEEANNRAREVIKETKLIYSDFFSKQSGNKIYFKSENLQQAGAYKVRGAYYKASTMDGSAWGKDLITTLAGNHVQGVASAAKLAGMKAAVRMSIVTLPMKVNRIKVLGVEVMLSDDTPDDVLKRAYETTAGTGATFMRPSDDLTVATGQGSIAMEIMKELSMVDHILMLIGGGGLAGGVSALTRLLNLNIRVIGAEPENVACIRASLTAGGAVVLPSANTVVDGTVVRRPGEKVFPYIRRSLDGIITIQDNELIVPFLDTAKSYKMIVENSGPLTVAALKHLDVENKKIVSTLSGGNMDMIAMASLIQRGLIQRDCIFAVSALLPNKSGQLARVAEVIAEESGNVIKLGHNQFVSTNRNAAAEFRTTMEAPGTEYKEKICGRLKREGYRLKLVHSKGTYGE